MSTIYADSISSCANCGKGGEGDNDIQLKTCTACKLVKYCSRECQIAHRPQHKRECKKRAKELHDEKLFEQHPPLEDCPICMVRLPTLVAAQSYMACCGKIICSGCLHAVQSGAVKEEDDVCPFCRTPPVNSGEDLIPRYKKRIDLNDPIAVSALGDFYSRGLYGLQQNQAKALELYHQAGALGCAEAYYNIGIIYENGRGVDLDKKKAKHYYELAAMSGVVEARNNLGAFEMRAGNRNRALKHWNTAVEGGNKNSLENIKRLYMKGDATKEDYATALGKYQEYVDEIRSVQGMKQLHLMIRVSTINNRPIHHLLPITIDSLV